MEAIKILEDQASNGKDEELQKIQKMEFMRLRCKMLTKENRFDEANSMYNEAIKAADQNLLTLWRDWMIMNIKAYELHKKS